MSDTGLHREKGLAALPRHHTALAAGLVALSTLLVGVASANPKTLLLTMGGAAALLFAMAVWADPWMGLIGYLCYSSLHMYVKSFVPTLVNDLLLFALVMIVFVHAALRRTMRKRLLALDVVYVAWLGIYAAYLLASMGQLSLGSIVGFRDTFEFVSLSLVVPLVVSDARKLRRTVECLILLNLGIALGALLGKVAGLGSGLAVLYTGVGPAAGAPEVRVISTVGNPNTLGTVMAMCILLVLPRLGHLRDMDRRLPYYGLIPFCLVALMLAGSRASFYILVATVGLLLVFGDAGVVGHLAVLIRGRVRRGLVAALVAAVALLGVAPIVAARLMTRDSPLARMSLGSLGAKLSLVERLGVWQSLYSRWNWLTGVGVGGYSRAGVSIHDIQVTDSYVVKVLLEQGTIGGCLFWGLLGYVFVRALRFHWSRPAWRDVSWSIVAVLFYFSLLSIPYCTFDIFPANAWCWCLIGLFLTLLRLDREERRAGAGEGAAPDAQLRPQ